MRKATALGAALVLLVLFSLQDAFGQGTVFTYQGRLSQNGVPFTGTAEIAPTLWDAASGGNPVGTNNPVTLLVTVSNGLFNASLDFGSSPFTAGAARWLQLGVRTTLGPFTILSPLQPLTATPYAITAGYVTTAGTATSFSGPLAGNVTGTQGATSVGGTSPATSPVGSFAPNGYGLYDMAGNVWQWCWDWYGTPYAGGTDPRGVASGSYRVIRGGGWSRGASFCRAAYRYYGYPTNRYYSLGFRSVLPPGQ